MSIIYPLEEILGIKKRRVIEAEKVVKEKEEGLRQQQEKLVQVKEERDKVQNHLLDKVNQLRTSLDEGTTSPEVQQKKYYIEVVQDNVVKEDEKVKNQEEKVELAKKELEQAKLDLKDKIKQVDKLETHKEGWTKEMQAELDLKEANELDEIGNILYLKNKRDKPSF